MVRSSNLPRSITSFCPFLSSPLLRRGSTVQLRCQHSKHHQYEINHGLGLGLGVRYITTTPTHASSETSTISTSSDPTAETESLYVNLSPLKSPIRNHLREWSRVDEESRKLNAPDNIVVGRTTSLPNSLFSKPQETEAEQDVEGETLENDEDEDSVFDKDSFLLKPGDLFKIAGDNIRQQLAIHIGTVGTQSQYFLQDGRWIMMDRQQFKSYIVRSFASPEEVQGIRFFLPKQAVESPIGEGGQVVSIQASGQVPHPAAKSLLARFAEVSEEAELFKRDHLHVFDNLYETFADDIYWKTTSITELVEQFLKKDFKYLSSGAQMSISSVLIEGDHRIHTLLKRDTSLILVAPKRLARSMENVTVWAREYQDAAARAVTGKNVSKELELNPLSTFINKARILIQRSRKLRSPTSIGILGPSQSSDGTIQKISSGETFDDTDKQIVYFLWNLYVRQPKFAVVAGAHHKAIGAFILRAVGAYPQVLLDRKIGKLLLQELGCLDPWTGPMFHSITLSLPQLKLLKEAVILKEQEDRAVTDLKWTPSSPSLPFPDSMSHLRRDWGSLEIFAIDEPSTKIVDDGISIEPSADHPGHYWIHVHVAHPAAFVPWRHAFERRARHQGAAFYGQHWLETAMPHSLLQRMGVADDNATLTVSTLLSVDGTVKDIQIVPGMARNVVRLSKYAVRQVMQADQPDFIKFTVGSGKFQTAYTEEHDHEAAVSLASKHVNTLLLFQRIFEARWTARQRENPNFLAMKQRNGYSIDVRVSEIGEDIRNDRIFDIVHSYGDPTIEVTCPRKPSSYTIDHHTTRYDIVAAAMTLAGESTGYWMRKRQIPGVFMGQYLAPSFPVSKLNNLGPHDPYITPVSALTSIPNPYFSLNLKQYMQVTSPLRRYYDLFLQYQINSYLKAEASGRLGPGAPVLEQDVLAFSEEDVIRELQLVNATLETKGAASRSKTHWLFQALFRAFHFKQARLPEVWDVEIDNPVALGIRTETTGAVLLGRLVPFGVKAIIMSSSEGFEKQAKFRQFLPVKLELVDPIKWEVVCKAVGPPTEEPLSRIEFD